MRLPLYCLIVALTFLLASSPASATGLETAAQSQSSASSSATAPLCIFCEEGPFCSSGVPKEHCAAAAFVYEFAMAHNYSPPPGYRGGSVYRNTNNALPPGGDYLEYRIYTAPGSAQRLVIDRKLPGPDNAWFTDNHYTSFSKFYLLNLA
jgi:hypothetical protein